MGKASVVLTGAAALCSLLTACADAHDVGQTVSSLALSGRKAAAAEPDAGAHDEADGGSEPAGLVERIGQPVAALDQRFQFPEGPVWSAEQNTLYFTDISGDAIYRLQLPDTLETVQKPAGQPDGLALGPDHTLYVAGFGARNVWRMVMGEQQVLAESYQGKRFNSPDDVIVRSDGTVYFTDPTFGIDGTVGLPRQTRELDFEGVYRIDARGELHLEDMAIPGPNGVRLSPDERTLYVSSTTRGAVYAYDVQADGSLTNQRVWNGQLLAADSFCLDEQGNVYIATALGISVLSPDGALLGSIRVSGLASNVAFGGPDRRSLFITTRSLIPSGSGPTGRLWRIDAMPIPGLTAR